MIRRPPRSTPKPSSAASDVYKRQVETIIAKIIADGGFSGMGSMGQVMGAASKELAGKADGKTISTIVKKLLT